jgi:hypothetical protein
MKTSKYTEESTCEGKTWEDRERDNTREREKEPQEGKERKKKRGKGKGKTRGERLRWRGNQKAAGRPAVRRTSPQAESEAEAKAVAFAVAERPARNFQKSGFFFHGQPSSSISAVNQWTVLCFFWFFFEIGFS